MRLAYWNWLFGDCEEVVGGLSVREGEMKMTEGDHRLTHYDIYKTLWKCRDFELNTLWQRSIMLGTFMVVTYSGYGMFLLWGLEKGTASKWPLFNLMSIGLCCFGMAFSTLWVLMLKGSKNWYETCEAALNAFQESAPNDAFASEDVRGLSAFGVFWTEKTHLAKVKHEENDSLLSTAAGNYSVSRVAIAIGQISLLCWVGLSLLHFVALAIGPVVMKALLVPKNALIAGGVSVSLGIFVCTVVLKACTHSRN